MSRKKIATIWLGGCSGCHMSFLDIDERILDVVQLADIVKCPVVDQKEFPECDVVLVEGSIANQEHLEEIQHIRKKAKVVVAFGDCAVTGNITALRNQVTKQQALECSYLEVPGTVDGLIPDQEISPILDRICPIHEVVDVDYYLPGCPPSADLIFYVLFELLNDRKPELNEENLKYG